MKKEQHLIHVCVIFPSRYGVKLAIDQTVLGEVSSLEELQEYMEEYDRDCYIGLETDAAWADAILQSKPNLFSLSYNPTQVSSKDYSLQLSPDF